MLYIRGHKIIKGYVGNAPVSHVGFGKSGLIKIKSENGGSDYPNNLIAKYTTNASGVLPVFNDGYQYTVNETESNGVYTVELFSDDDFTRCNFKGKTDLLTVDYLKVTDKVTAMDSMFHSCSKLTQLDVSNWDTSNVTNMSSMFYGCSALTQLDLSTWNTSNVTSIGYMFHTCTKLTQLDLSSFNTSNVTNMNSLVRGCSALTQLDLSTWDTSNVTNMSFMFRNCTKLTQLDLSSFNTSNVTSMQNMFYTCSKLTQLDVSNFDTSKVTNMSDFIANASVLQNFISCAIPVSFGASGTALTHDSLMSIINNLATVTTTQTLTLGSTNLAKLSSEEKAIATNKGWTLA